MYAFILCIIALISVVSCTSSGQMISVCNATSDVYGCLPNKWHRGNRKACEEKDKIMSWVSRGVESDMYTITFGANEQVPVTRYLADELIPLHIRTHVHLRRWRGILIYAEDSSNNRVGSWEIPVESTVYFQNSPDCENSIIHNSGVKKPYHVTVHWRAPSTAVGTITFHCLIKQGDANTGAFYFPVGALSGNLKLIEANGPKEFSPWVRSELNQNCNEACALTGRECNVDQMNAISTPELFTKEIASRNLCKLPLLSGCNSLGVTSSTDRLCYYGSTIESCNQQKRTFEETTCEAKSDNPYFGQRWCYCGGDPKSGITIVADTSEVTESKIVSEVKTVTQVETALDSQGNEMTQEVVVTESQTAEAIVTKVAVQTREVGENCLSNKECASGVCQRDGKCFMDSGSSSLKSQLFTFVILGLGFFNFGYSKYGVFIMISLILVSGADAHNWIHSKARAAGTASTDLPCPARVSEKPHTQVGRNQLFQIEWMTGHQGTPTQFVALHESHKDKLSLHNEDFLKKYINQAADGTNLMGDKRWQKRHRTDHMGDVNSGRLVTELKPGDESYLATPPAFSQQGDEKLYTYAQQHIDEDSYHEYSNPNFPWIEAVWKYRHSIDRAHEWDVAEFKLPARAGFGRYIIHFIWRGYRDCIEVDIMNAVVPEAQIYGTKNGADVWSMVPHCFFEGDAPDDPPETRSRCQEATPNILGTLEDCNKQDVTECNGINVVPYKYPDSVNQKWRNFQGIPVLNTWCNGTMDQWHETSTPKQRESMFVSFALRPEAATTTKWFFTVTDDPEDPYFYSTCFNRKEDRTFIGYEDGTIATQQEHPWRFLDSCISCENRARNAKTLWPTFDFVDTCVNCDAEPEPFIPTFIQLANNKHCKGWGNDCPNNDNNCIKKVTTYTNKWPETNPEDCSFLAGRDPECSDYFWVNGDNRCECYRSKSCCMEVGCQLNDRNNARVFKNIDTPDSPDPNCDRGLKVDGNCCSQDKDDNVDFCCENCLNNRPCSQFGPPCKP